MELKEKYVPKELIQKVLKYVNGYDSSGQEVQAYYVAQAIGYLLHKKPKEIEAAIELKRSGLTVRGMLYFAMRNYLADREQYVYEFLFKHFDTYESESKSESKSEY